MIGSTAVQYVTVYAIIAPSLSPSPSKAALSRYDPLTNNSLTNALVACLMVLAFCIAGLVGMFYFFRKFEAPRLHELHVEHKRIERSKSDDIHITVADEAAMTAGDLE